MPLGYGGNPANYPVTVNIPTGSDAPSSSLFQTAYEGTLDRSAALAAHGWLGNLVTLQAPFAWSTASSKGPYAICWDDTSPAVDPAGGQRWLAAAWDNGLANIQVYAGWADGNAWAQLGANIPYTHSPTSVCVDSSGNIYVAGIGGSSITVADVFKLAPGGGSFSSAAALAIAAGTCTDNELVAVGTNVYVGLGSATGAASIWQVGGGSALVGSLSTNAWIGRGNGSCALFVPGQATATPTAYKIVGSTLTSAAIGLASTDIPQDLVWSAAWNMFVLVAKTSGDASTIWTTPDGVTWTLVKTLSPLPNPIVNLVAVGPFLIGALANPSNGTPNQLVSSVDGGVTWVAHPTGTIVPTVTVSKLVASPSQVIAFSEVTINTNVVGNLRVSHIAGQGGVALT